MNSEETILLVFVVIITIGVPLLLWFMFNEKKREEERVREEWNRKNYEKLYGNPIPKKTSNEIDPMTGLHSTTTTGCWSLFIYTILMATLLILILT